MESSVKNERNGLIDVLRLVFAIGVVMIHTSALQSVGEPFWIATSLGLSRMAVPFFFVVSGYYFYKNCKKENYTKKTVKRLLKLYVSWVIIEFVLLAVGYIPMVIMKDPFQIFRMIFFVGVTGSLWYVISLVYAILINSYFFKKDKLIIPLIIGAILFLFGTTGDIYGGIFNNKLIEGYKFLTAMPQAGITSSILFVTIGAIVCKYELDKKIKKAGILSLVGIGVVLIEAFTLYYTKTAVDYNMYISLIFVAPLIFIWVLQSNIKVESKVSTLCRELSLGIYCIHQAVMMLLFFALPFVMTNTVIRFVVVLTLSTLIILLLRKFKVTRKLVS